MNIKSRFNKFTMPVLFLFLSVVFSYAQGAKFISPRQEKLLNGMNLLVWNDPNASKVSVKLRVHSGSAFDRQGKEGTMALLADALFPTDAAKEFFTEDLGGSLEVTSNYDYIQINATANSDQFLTMLETVAVAVTNLQTDKETTAKVRAARLEKVKELEKNPSYIADQAVAKRLFGEFPYGRPQMGTSESLAKIDFADLTLAKQRFLTADNATLAVVGGVKSDLVYRAARRFFGAWTRGDKKVPATFRQPDAPKPGLPVFNSPIQKTSEFRLALRGLSRNDKDFYASQILEKILQNRFRAREGKNAFVRQESHVLPGLFIFGVSDWNLGLIKRSGGAISLPILDDYQNNFLKDAIKTDEFEKAKVAFSAQFNKTDSAEIWLDADTFKLSPVKTDLQNAQNVTITDAQRVLENLKKEAVVTILVFSDDGSNANSVKINQ